MEWTHIMKRDFINISKKIFVLFIITILFVFFGSCSSLAEKNFSEESRIVNKSKYYEIIKINNLYYYTIFKKNGNVSERSAYFPKRPEILIQDELIRISYQSGTGSYTKWSYYYDVDNDRFSRYFYSVYDKYDDMIAYGSQNEIIIENIFGGKIYKRIKKFNYPLSCTTEPFIDAKFNEDGTILKVTYLTGDDYQRVTENFDLI